MRRLLGWAGRRGKAVGRHERYDPWDRLVAEAPAGIAGARATLRGVAAAIVPELGGRTGAPVVLGTREAERVLEAFVSELVWELRTGPPTGRRRRWSVFPRPRSYPSER